METRCPICMTVTASVAALTEAKLFRCPKCNWLFSDAKPSPVDKSNLDNDKRDEYLAIVQKATMFSGMTDGCRVLDVGSSDGTLLGWYLNKTITVGVESNVEQMKVALNSKRVDVPIMAGFGYESFKNQPKFRIITVIDVFQDYDIVSMLNVCKKILAEMGVIVVQCPYLPQLMTEEITVCRNYPLVFTLRTLVPLLGLEVQGVEFPKKGMRAYITHPNNKEFGKYDFEAKLKIYTTMSAAIMTELRSRFDLDETYKGLGQKSQQARESRNMYVAPPNT